MIGQLGVTLRSLQEEWIRLKKGNNLFSFGFTFLKYKIPPPPELSPLFNRKVIFWFRNVDYHLFK